MSSKYIRGTLTGGLSPNCSSLTGDLTSCTISLTGGIGTAAGKVIKAIHSDTTANWDAQPELVGKKEHLYVYLDYASDGTVSYPGFKVGDGDTLLSDLPFACAKWGNIQGDISDQEDLLSLIHSITIDDLQQEEGSYFILDCGTSSRIVEDPS